MVAMVMADQNSSRLLLWRMYRLLDVPSFILVGNFTLLVLILKHSGYAPIPNSPISGKEFKKKYYIYETIFNVK